MVTGHWILHDALGVGLCVTYVSHIRLPNLKVRARSATKEKEGAALAGWSRREQLVTTVSRD